MSGAGENRWQQRRPGKNQERSSGANTPTKEKTTASNAWGGKGKTAPPTQRAAPEHHVPVRDFNASEVREFLRKRMSPCIMIEYLESTADQPAAYHKVQGDSVAKRSSGAWGTRGNMSHLMPSGQDFFTQLKKQLAAMDHSKPSQ